MNIQVTGLLGVWMDDYRAENEPPKTTLTIYYHATLSGVDAPRADLVEVDAAQWFDLDALAKPLAFPRHVPLMLTRWREAVRAGLTVGPLADRPEPLI